MSFVRVSRNVSALPWSNRARNVHFEKKVKDLGHQLPAQPADPKGNYMQYSIVQLTGSRQMVYLSGHLPQKVDGTLIKGRLGENMSIEQGVEASRVASLQILASLQRACNGNLDNVVKIHRISGFINSANDFADQPKVLNGCSDFLGEIFGTDIARHARSALGVNVLPLGVAVEIEAIVEIDNSKNK
jgi:enamine deaminase RidA (YjgF/YER057c/UK114 family)